MTTDKTDLLTKCGHKPVPAQPYLVAHADAERRLKRGEKQFKCNVCKLWVWGYLWKGTKR